MLFNVPILHFHIILPSLALVAVAANLYLRLYPFLPFTPDKHPFPLLVSDLLVRGPDRANGHYYQRYIERDTPRAISGVCNAYGRNNDKSTGMETIFVKHTGMGIGCMVNWCNDFARFSFSRYVCVCAFRRIRNVTISQHRFNICLCVCVCVYWWQYGSERQ